MREMETHAPRGPAGDHRGDLRDRARRDLHRDRGVHRRGLGPGGRAPDRAGLGSGARGDGALGADGPRRQLPRPAPPVVRLEGRDHRGTRGPRPSAGSATAAPRPRRRPAVEVRSTSPARRTAARPRRRARRPRRRSARPRGPRRARSCRRPATSTRDSGSAAASCRTSARSAARTSSTTSAVRASGATSGCQARRACLAASRAVACHFAWARAARSPFQTATLRVAAQGTTVATPTSVSTSTARSPRSPFGQRLHDDQLGLRPRLAAYVVDLDLEDPLAGGAHRRRSRPHPGRR